MSDDGSGGRVRIVLWIAIAALALARAAVALVPGTWLWGLDAQRFLPAALGWGTWAVLAAALIPPLGRRAGAWLERADPMAHPWRAALGVAALLAALVALLPDRTWFVGDFLMRYGTLEYRHGFLAMFPQFMPLDVWLFDTAPRALGDATGVPAAAYARTLGAVEAALFGACVVWLARELELRGPAAWAAIGVVGLGSVLCMFTGYLKPAGALCVLVPTIVAGGLRARRHAAGAPIAGLALAVALLLHRSAVILIPAFVVALVLAARAGASRRALAAGAALPALALGALAPRILRVFTTFDRPHHFDSSEIRAAGGLAGAALGGSRALDLLDLVLLLCPLAIALPALFPGVRRRGHAGAWIAGTLVVAFAATALLLHPQQGLFRDWDVFSPAGVALSVLVVILASPALERAGGGALALGLVLAVAVPAVQWLALAADRDRGLARVEAFVAGPPLRGAGERGTTLDFLGDRYAALQRWDRAARYLGEAAALAPSPRILQALGLATSELGDLEASRQAFLRLTERVPSDPAGWVGLVVVDSRRGDGEAALREARVLETLRPGNPYSRLVENAFGRADSAASRAPAADRR